MELFNKNKHWDATVIGPASNGHTTVVARDKKGFKGKFVCTTFKEGYDVEEAEKMAKLISSLPKMYTALVAMQNYLGDDEFHYDDIGDRDALKEVRKFQKIVNNALKEFDK